MELSPCSPKKFYYVDLGGIFMFIIDRNIVWHSCLYCLCGHHGNHYCICLSPLLLMHWQQLFCWSVFIIGFCLCWLSQLLVKETFHENQFIKEGQIISTGLCSFLLATILLSSLALAGCHGNTSQGYGLTLLGIIWLSWHPL